MQTPFYSLLSTGISRWFSGLIIGMVLTTMIVVGVDQVGAATYSVFSNGWCDNGMVNGVSVTSWDGQSSSSTGYVNGALWYASNGKWIKQMDTTDTVGPDDFGVARAFNLISAPDSTRRYSQTGAHTASFFSGTKKSETPSWDCSR
ncbi:MAG: hypothetical protein GFH27_549347n57 [Chloroflexi bacterium AL-W]|nr:hypothetical protein [Chloroflexi bacterium AL-N1]NOK70839.1 hypothetical protein [Chloroflexi bacterium AL-N10]NOK78399.1 hypothetical protein [Chloroflexi bacterium AL-N5]NOK85380.1 hypothetical protein [Chloroflexi bacterium AL-W]NOK92656.1 hypothetical protein [Chloroflexi bacterium AL-N15]